MTTMKQICCAAGLCLSMAMLLALANHAQLSETLKLSPAGRAAAAVSVPTAITPGSSATVFDPVLDYSRFSVGRGVSVAVVQAGLARAPIPFSPATSQTRATGSYPRSTPLGH